MYMYVTVLLTIFTLILIPIYYKKYGLKNFLWFSDIGLFLTVIALWLHSSLIMSIATVSLLLPELLWNIDFFVELTTRYKFLGLARYMFDTQYSLFLRVLSLFHVVLPIIWIWSLIAWGYDPHALFWAVLMCWIVLLVTYLFTNPKENINWVFLPEHNNWQHLTTRTWFGILLILFPLVYWLMHNFLLFITK